MKKSRIIMSTIYAARRRSAKSVSFVKFKIDIFQTFFYYVGNLRTMSNRPQILAVICKSDPPKGAEDA